MNKIFKLFISELSDIRTKIKESNACIEKDFGIKISPKERKKSQIIFENEFVNYISKKKEYFVSYRKKNHTNIMEYPISLDTALQIVGSLKVRAIKEKNSTENPAEIEKLEFQIRTFLEEERMLYGADKYKKNSVMDKVVNYYSPLIKRLNGFT